LRKNFFEFFFQQDFFIYPVAKIKKEVPPGKFRGLLIGNGDPSKRKVSFEDGLNFKNKHSLSEFIEVQPSSQNLNEILLDFLNKKD